MKEYKGYYLPSRLCRKPREHTFQAAHDRRAAVLFAVLCDDNGWELLNVTNDETCFLFNKCVSNV